MTRTSDSDLKGIEQRNLLRQAASLPLLSVEDELRRLEAVRDQVEFGVEWEKRKAEFAHWISSGDG
jgi:hypothetical protein